MSICSTLAVQSASCSLFLLISLSDIIAFSVGNSPQVEYKQESRVKVLKLILPNPLADAFWIWGAVLEMLNCDPARTNITLRGHDHYFG